MSDESNIELRIANNTSDWQDVLVAANLSCGHSELPDDCWTLLSKGDANFFKKLTKLLDSDKDRIALEGVSQKDDKFITHFWTVLDPDELVVILVNLFNKMGHSDVDALVYSEYCESIIDDDGISHEIGTRYFMDNNGQVLTEQYPEIEYIYID